MNIFVKVIYISFSLLTIFISADAYAKTEKIFENRIEWIVDRTWRVRNINLKVFPIKNQKPGELIANFKITDEKENISRKRKLEYLNNIGFLTSKKSSNNIKEYSLTINGWANLSGSSGFYLGNYEFDKITKLEKINIHVEDKIIVYLVEANLKANLLDWAKDNRTIDIFPEITRKTKDISEYYILFEGAMSFDHSMKIRKNILDKINRKFYDGKKISGVFNLETILPNKEEKDLFEKTIAIKPPEDKEIVESIKKSCSNFLNTDSIKMLLFRRIDFPGYPGTELKFKFTAKSKEKAGVMALCYGALSYNRVHKTLSGGGFTCDDLIRQ